MNDPVVNDTNRYHSEQASLERIYETCEKEVASWTDHQLIEQIINDAKVGDLFYDFIMADLRQTHCKLQGIDPDFMRTKLGGIPNLLIELFQPENYLTYFWDMVPEQQEAFRKIVAEYMAEQQINEME